MLEQDAPTELTNTTAEAPEAQPDTQPAGTEQDHKPKANGFQKRVDKLTRNLYELKGERAELLRRLQAYESGQTGATKREAQEGAEGNEGAEDLDAKIQKAAERLQQQREADRARETATKTWKQQEAEARKQFEDYDDVVPEFVESASLPAHVEAAILECEKPVGVTYYLAKHPDEAESIAAMSPVRAIAAIGKIEARLEAPTVKKQSAAPEPIAPVKGKKADDGLGDDLSIEDWVKRRNAQVFKKK